MTLVPWNDEVPQNYLAQAVPPTEEDRSIWGAAFGIDNPVVNAYAAITRPAFQPQEGFDLETRLRENPDALSEPHLFAAVESDEEFEFLLNRVREQQANRQFLDSNGWAGFGASMVAGMLSPTILMPGGAIYRGVRGGVNVGRTAASGAGWAMAGASIDEGILYVTQETRQPEDFMLGVGTAAVLGGLIGGGAAALLTRGQIEQFEADMANGGTQTAIQPYTAQPVGAQVNPDVDDLVDPGGTLTVGLDRASTFINPVLRNLNQEFSPTLRGFQARLNTGGMYLQGNLEGIAVRGGEVASLRNQHYTKLYNALTQHTKEWNAYHRATPVGQRMNQKQFNEGVGRALERGGEGENEFITRVATAYRNAIFLPLLQEARRLGMAGLSEVSDEAAMRYMPRVLKQGIAERDRIDLEDILTEHVEETLFQRFKRQYERLEGALERDEQTLADVGLDEGEAAAVRAQLETEMATLPQRFPEVADLAEQIRSMRASVRGQRGPEATAIRQAANDLEEANKDALAEFHKAERGLRGRFRNLTMTRAGFEKRQQKVLDQIERVENQQLDTIRSVTQRAQKLMARYERGEEIKANELERLRDQFERAYLTFERNAKRLDKMRELPEGFEHLVYSDPRSSERISKLEDRQQAREAALDDLMERLDDLESGRPQEELYQNIRENYNNMIEASVRINNRRAGRLEKLKEKAAALDPETSGRIQQKLRSDIDNRRLEFMDRLQTDMKADVRAKTDPSGRMNLEGKSLSDAVSFRNEAQRIARSIYAKMTGEGNRVPAAAMMSERGPELARTLDIDPTRVWSNGRSYEEFLERDIEKVSRRYMRTMATDLELQRAFGTVNPLERGSPIMEKIGDEFNESLRRIQDDTTLTERQRQKQTDRLNKQYQQALEDMRVQIDRLRYVRGVPDDPEAIPFRAGRLAMNLNLLRLLGGVVISSLPDLGSVLMRHGFFNAFRDGIVPMVRDLQTFKMSVAEARHAGVNLDIALHSRMAAMYDIMDEVEHGTMVERGVQTMANKFGLYSGMDHYNTGMKSFAGALINGRMMRSLEKMANGRASKGDITYLAANGLDGVDAERMWAEIVRTPGGGNKVNGAWLPNTESWQDQDLARMYRAALGRQVEMEIVTPGTERPNWMDANMWGRLIAQFRSFTFSSHMRMITASMQEARIGNGWNVAQGVTTSMSMGLVSYYLWATTRGGEDREEMLNASPEQWVNEALNRSGLLGILSEVKNVGEEMPGLREYATLGAEVSSRQQYSNVAGRLAGPTAGLISDLETVGTGLAGAIASNEIELGPRHSNAMRRLFPYQNHSALVRAFDAAQEYGNSQFGVE